MCVCKGMAHRHSATSWAFRPPRQKVSQLALRTSSGDSLGPGDPPLLTGHVMRGHVVVRPRPQARAAARWGPAFAPEVPAFVRQLLARWRRWRWWRRQRARSKMALRPGTGTGGGGAAGAGAGAPGGGRWVRRAGSEHPHLHRGVDLGGYGGFRECRPFSFELGYGRRGVRSLRGLRRGPGAGRLYSKLRATCCLGGRAGAGGKRRGFLGLPRVLQGRCGKPAHTVPEMDAGRRVCPFFFYSALSCLFCFLNVRQTGKSEDICISDCLVIELLSYRQSYSLTNCKICLLFKKVLKNMENH
jgi:hypothetical protein